MFPIIIAMSKALKKPFRIQTYHFLVVYCKKKKKKKKINNKDDIDDIAIIDSQRIP